MAASAAFQELSSIPGIKWTANRKADIFPIIFSIILPINFDSITILLQNQAVSAKQPFGKHIETNY